MAPALCTSTSTPRRRRARRRTGVRRRGRRRRSAARCSSASGSRLWISRATRRALVGVAHDQHDLGAEAGQALRGGQPEAGGGAGDGDDLALQRVRARGRRATWRGAGGSRGRSSCSRGPRSGPARCRSRRRGRRGSMLANVAARRGPPKAPVVVAGHDGAVTSWTPDWAAWPPALLDFWTERHLCTLTTLRADGRPHVVPVGVALDLEQRCAWVITSRDVPQGAQPRALPAPGRLPGRRAALVDGRGTRLGAHRPRRRCAGPRRGTPRATARRARTPPGWRSGSRSTGS